MDPLGQKFTAVGGVIAILLTWIVVLPWATGLGPPWAPTTNQDRRVGPTICQQALDHGQVLSDCPSP